MRILAIETTGHAMSVALVENDALVSEIFWHAGLRHSEKLIATIDRVMAEANWTLQYHQDRGFHRTRQFYRNQGRIVVRSDAGTTPVSSLVRYHNA